VKRYRLLRLFIPTVLLVVLALPVFAADNWRQEFDAVCSKTDISMTLSSEELKRLVERCDKLKTIIETQDESTRKVFRKRLQLCRDLYDFVLKSREQEKKQ
jgi:hypothetical protein